MVRFSLFLGIWLAVVAVCVQGQGCKTPVCPDCISFGATCNTIDGCGFHSTTNTCQRINPSCARTLTSAQTGSIFSPGTWNEGDVPYICDSVVVNHILSLPMGSSYQAADIQVGAGSVPASYTAKVVDAGFINTVDTLTCGTVAADQCVTGNPLSLFCSLATVQCDITPISIVIKSNTTTLTSTITTSDSFALTISSPVNSVLVTRTGTLATFNNDVTLGGTSLPLDTPVTITLNGNDLDLVLVADSADGASMDSATFTVATTPADASECIAAGTFQISLEDADPHFHPFGSTGVSFMPAGESMRVYNIISSFSLNFNERWIHYNGHPGEGASGVHVLEKSFRISRTISEGERKGEREETRVFVSPDARAKAGRFGSLLVRVNGELLENINNNNKRRVFSSDPPLYVSFSSSSAHTVHVETDDFEFVISLKHNSKNMVASLGRQPNQPNRWPYLDMEVLQRHSVLTTELKNAHGILGQTLRQIESGPLINPSSMPKGYNCVECFVEGPVSDYEMPNLWAIDYKHNQFQHDE